MTGAAAGLEALLAGEHAAIYAYGTAGAALAKLAAPAALAIAVRTGLDAHRAARDELADVIAAAGGTAPAPRAGYRIPFALGDVAAVVRLLLLVEDRLAVLAANAVAGQPGRTLAADILSASAVRAARLQLAGGAAPRQVAVAFPGLPSLR